ncbi:hypothetical protein HDU93_001599 [Gonapodya sp. JEL0774]|nr:hypothetical protein HDU93_001599 [Gonapodya sp. JEL0774]
MQAEPNATNVASVAGTQISSDASRSRVRFSLRTQPLQIALELSALLKKLKGPHIDRQLQEQLNQLQQRIEGALGMVGSENISQDEKNVLELVALCSEARLISGSTSGKAYRVAMPLNISASPLGKKVADFRMHLKESALYTSEEVRLLDTPIRSTSLSKIEEYYEKKYQREGTVKAAFASLFTNVENVKSVYKFIFLDGLADEFPEAYAPPVHAPPRRRPLLEALRNTITTLLPTVARSLETMIFGAVSEDRFVYWITEWVSDMAQGLDNLPPRVDKRSKLMKISEFWAEESPPKLGKDEFFRFSRVPGHPKTYNLAIRNLSQDGNGVILTVKEGQGLVYGRVGTLSGPEGYRTVPPGAPLLRVLEETQRTNNEVVQYRLDPSAWITVRIDNLMRTRPPSSQDEALLYYARLERLALLQPSLSPVGTLARYVDKAYGNQQITDVISDYNYVCGSVDWGALALDLKGADSRIVTLSGVQPERPLPDLPTPDMNKALLCSNSPVPA